MPRSGGSSLKQLVLPHTLPHTGREIATEGHSPCWELSRLPGALAAALAVSVAGQARHSQSPGPAGASPKAAALPRPRCPTAAQAVPACQASCHRGSFQMASANTGQVLGSNLPSGLLVIILAGTDPAEGAAAAPYPGFSPKLGEAAGFLWKRLHLSLNSYMWGIGNNSLDV